MHERITYGIPHGNHELGVNCNPALGQPALNDKSYNKVGRTFKRVNKYLVRPRYMMYSHHRLRSVRSISFTLPCSVSVL